MSKQIFTVYVHVFPNHKMYVGLTSTKVNQRWDNGKGYNNQNLMRRAITKYGWGSIEHIVIAERLTQEEAYQLEIDLIKYWNTTNPEEGYNNSSGGEFAFGYKHSKETKQKISIATRKAMKNLSPEKKQKLSNRKGVPSQRRGIKLTAEEKEYISTQTQKAMDKLTPTQKGLGQKRTPEQRKRISDAHKGVVSRPKGFHLSDDLKKKISDTITGSRWMYKNDKCLQVKSFDVQTYLDDGFVFGRIKFDSGGTKWINDGVKNFRVKENDVDSLLLKGYALGQFKKEQR